MKRLFVVRLKWTNLLELIIDKLGMRDNLLINYET